MRKYKYRENFAAGAIYTKTERPNLTISQFNLRRESINAADCNLDKGVIMKLFKRSAAVLLAAVLSVSAALTAYAAPADAGDPTGAELLIDPDKNTSDTTQSSTDPDTAPITDPGKNPGTTVQTPYISSDKTFEAPDTQNWRWWDGSSELRANTDYYIRSMAGLTGDVILPEGSRLMIGEDAKLYLYNDANFIVKGTLIVSPTAEILSSGVLSIADGALFENYGHAKFTQNSTVNISSAFAAYSDSETAFAGRALVYSSGRIVNFGSLFVPVKSDVTVTGRLQNKNSGMLYTAGNITVTLSGTLELEGFVDLQDHARILNSGTTMIYSNTKYYTDENARFTNTQSGRLIDFRSTKPTDPTNPSIPADEFKNGVKGIDVSVWQGAIDWKKVAVSGVKFAIIRSSSGSRVDKLFDYNITEASKAGIHVGVYHYCYAMNVEEAREEARHFIETIKPYKIDYPVMFDFEDNSQIPLGKEKLTEIAEVFLSEVKAAGYYPMIYSYRNWLELNLDMDRLSEYEVALAEWNVATPKYTRPYGIWQYSCKGKISGIEGDVDLDLCFKDYAKLIKDGGFNHLSDFE